MKLSREIKTGIIVIITLLGFWWLFQFFKGKNIFSSEDIYYVKYDTVDGLEVSKPITINGLRVGSIASIDPVVGKDQNISFLVKMQIDKKFHFSKNSIAEIYEIGMMQGSGIRILLAKDNAQFVKVNDTIKGRVSIGLVSMLSNEVKPLKDNANNALLSLDSTLNSANKLLDADNRQNLKLVIKNLNDAVIEIKKLAASSHQLVNGNSSKIATLLNNSNKAVETTNTTVAKFGETADKINQLQIEKTIANLQTTLHNVNELTSKINNGEGSMGKLMNDPSMYNNLNDASKNLSSLLEDLKTNPKRYVHFSIFGGGNKDKKNTEKK